MIIEDFEKTKEQLEEQKKENNKKIVLCDERTRMAKVNSFEYKAGTTLTFSMVGYFAIFLASSALIKGIGVTAFTNVIPALSYPAIVVGSSLGVGTLINTLMAKKYQTKERLKAFSIAKTQTEKLEEEIHYEIELEKANNRNLVIDQAINVLNSNESMLRRISSKYDISDKSTLKTEEEARKRIEQLSTFIKEQYDKLDILSTQKVLHDRFWRIRSKFQKSTDIIMAAVISGMVTMHFTGFPLMMVNEAITYSTEIANLATIFSPFIAGIIGASGYMAKRNKDHKKVFDSLNSQLGENALPEIYEKYEGAYEEQEEIKALIETQIRDISLAVIQLKEEQQVLESMESKTNQEKKETREKTLDDMLYTEEEIKLYMRESQVPSNPESISGIDKVIEEQQDLLLQEQSGQKLVKKLTSTKSVGNK